MKTNLVPMGYYWVLPVYIILLWQCTKLNTPQYRKLLISLIPQVVMLALLQHKYFTVNWLHNTNWLTYIHTYIHLVTMEVLFTPIISPCLTRLDETPVYGLLTAEFRHTHGFHQTLGNAWLVSNMYLVRYICLITGNPPSNSR